MQIGGGIGLECGFVGRVGGNQCVADVGDVDFGVGDRLPRVRIGSAPEPQRGNAGARNDHFGALGRRTHEALGRALETEAIEDDNIGSGQLFGVRRRRHVAVNVAVRSDQGCDLDTISTHVACQIRKNRKAGGDVDLTLRQCRPSQRRGKGRRRAPRDTAHHASRCRLGSNCRSTPPTGPVSTDPRQSAPATRIMAGPAATPAWNESSKPK